MKSDSLRQISKLLEKSDAKSSAICKKTLSNHLAEFFRRNRNVVDLSWTMEWDGDYAISSVNYRFTDGVGVVIDDLEEPLLNDAHLLEDELYEYMDVLHKAFPLGYDVVARRDGSFVVDGVDGEAPRLFNRNGKDIGDFNDPAVEEAIKAGHL